MRIEARGRGSERVCVCERECVRERLLGVGSKREGKRRRERECVKEQMCVRERLLGDRKTGDGERERK